MKNSTFAIATAVVLGVGVASPVQAKPKKEQLDTINATSIALREIEVRDAKHVTTTEIGTAHAWLKEAEHYAQRRRTSDQYEQAIARLNAVLVLVDALLTEEAAEAKALKADAEAKAAQEIHAKTVEKAEELEGRKAELEGALSK